jgi:hypothetical protein
LVGKRGKKGGRERDRPAAAGPGATRVLEREKKKRSWSQPSLREDKRGWRPPRALSMFERIDEIEKERTAVSTGILEELRGIASAAGKYLFLFYVLSLFRLMLSGYYCRDLTRLSASALSLVQQTTGPDR